MKLRVAYAKSRYKDKTYITPLVVTSYRDEKGVARNKTILSLAKMPDFIVELIDKALKRGDSSVLEEYVCMEEVEHVRSVVLGPVFVVLSILKQLGIYQLLRASLTLKQATVILAIIVERVVAPKPLSVMALQRTFAQSPLAHLLDMAKAPALKTWYGALGRLEEQRESILQQLYARNHTPGTLYLYDITSSYFEGDTCPLAAFGYNRDGKKGKKQVVIGVICDEAGCPIWIDVFAGNTTDQTTVKQELLNLKNKLGLENFIFVGDRGMVTNARIKELDEEGWWESFRYISALTRQEMMSRVEDDAHPIQLELFDPQNLVEVEEDGERYVLCHNPQRMAQDCQTRQRLLALTEEKLQNIKKNVEAGRIKKKDVIAKRLYRWVNRWNMSRFFEVQYDEEEFTYERKEDEIERYARLDGCYVIRSNVEPERQSTEGLRNHYKDLKYVEQTFCTMKTTDIQVRPIRHFNEAQVRGHIFACFLAYRVVWELRQRLHPVLERDPDTKRCEAGSLIEIWRELEGISLAKLQANAKTYFKLSKISRYAKKLLSLCGVSDLQEVFSE
ncbi:MAG: IS1634 family transposase [Candidatus Hydrogenedentes bacterium]|nr:IS1634 family transposase [Candidatus Hydrogenedentota bacterium]